MSEQSTESDALRNLVSDWQANGNSRPLGDPTANTWQECALQLLRVLDGSGERRKVPHDLCGSIQCAECNPHWGERYNAASVTAEIQARYAAKSDRGTTDARNIAATIGLIVAFSPMFAARWLGPWMTGGLVVCLAVVWVAAMVCMAGGGLRDRLDELAPTLTEGGEER